MIFNGSFILRFPLWEEPWISKKPPTAGDLHHPYPFRGTTDKRRAHGGLTAVYPIFNHAHCVNAMSLGRLVYFISKVEHI